MRNILQQKIKSILLPSLNNFGLHNRDIDDTSLTSALYRSLKFSRMCTFFYDKTSSMYLLKVLHKFSFNVAYNFTVLGCSESLLLIGMDFSHP